MTIGIFGGSFNPVHNAHITLARSIVSEGLADKVLMVLSPANPFKAGVETLAPDDHRLAMLKLATAPYPELEVSDIELSLPRPSYSIVTLQELQRRLPDTRLRLLIGGDNLAAFHKWKDYRLILKEFSPIVYPRPGVDCSAVLQQPEFSSVSYLGSLPQSEISATQIRMMLEHNENVNNLLPASVLEYIKSHNVY